MTRKPTRDDAVAVLNAIRISLVACFLVGCLSLDPGGPQVANDVPTAEEVEQVFPSAKRGRFDTSRKAVIGYWSGTRVC